jgi:hypothetical protein
VPKLNSTNLRALMDRKDLTPTKLAEKIARSRTPGSENISLRSLSRYLGSASGVPYGRNVADRIVHILAKVLETTPEVLTGERPLPSEHGTTLKFTSRVSEEVSTRARNMLRLTAIRYGLSERTILEFAPLAAMLLAEASLCRRRATVAGWKAAYEAQGALGDDLRHLPVRVRLNATAEEAIAAEEKSIAQRDIFGETIAEDTGLESETWGTEYDHARDNPCAVSLRALAAQWGAPVEIEEFDAVSVSYRMCDDVALRIACGDQQIAEEIVAGHLDLGEMPRGLMRREKEAERLAWLREAAAPMRELLDSIDLDLPSAPSPGGESSTDGANRNQSRETTQ